MLRPPSRDDGGRWEAAWRQIFPLTSGSRGGKDWGLDGMFRVKICGVTTPADARMVAEAGADCIGLNFVAGSPRALGVEAARAVAAAIPPGVLRVGVFAGKSAAEIVAIANAVGLDAIQLHGHLGGDSSVMPTAASPPFDPPGLCAQLAPLPVIRAVRLREDGPAASALDPARAWIAAAESSGQRPAMVIVDAGAPPSAAAGSLGGTGKVVDWGRLLAAGDPGLPLAVAGGLTAANVAAAIQACGARAVDTASGVEQSPGHKDPRLVRAFVAAALAAFPGDSPPLPNHNRATLRFRTGR